MVLLAIWGSVGGGSPVNPVELRRAKSFPPFHHITETRPFIGKERACVIIVGTTNQAYMGLYVYDAHGNCVALDDMGNAATRDQLAVEWYPPETGPYAIEVRNLGPLANGFEIVVR
jgi:hypothetical protein